FLQVGAALLHDVDEPGDRRVGQPIKGMQDRRGFIADAKSFVVVRGPGSERVGCLKRVQPESSHDLQRIKHSILVFALQALCQEGDNGYWALRKSIAGSRVVQVQACDGSRSFPVERPQKSSHDKLRMKLRLGHELLLADLVGKPRRCRKREKLKVC